MELKLVPKRIFYTKIYLNDKYLYTEIYPTYKNPTPRFTNDELEQLSKCC